MDASSRAYPVTIKAPRLRLREIDVDNDLDAIFAMISDSDITKYLPIEPQTRESEREALEAMTRDARAEHRAQWHLVAEAVDGGEVCGMGRIGITPQSDLTADIGYFVRRDLWGRGYGTEIAFFLVEFGFSALGMHRVWATVDPRNAASQRVLESVGMTREGRLRQHLQRNGVWSDSFVYSVLEQEWPPPTR